MNEFLITCSTTTNGQDAIYTPSPRIVYFDPTFNNGNTSAMDTVVEADALSSHFMMRSRGCPHVCPKAQISSPHLHLTGPRNASSDPSKQLDS
mmetsp:Transcript_22539/g.37851  ORF Transcript_22539/g.37851 Transcript_22539/m.37851 type:complete len:93 (+) Transcript_22539:1269-1547(+)